jgi:hypothetical protein
MATAHLTGSAEALALWMQQPIDASGACDDQIREDVMGDAHTFTRFAVKGNLVILKTLKGRTILETVERNGSRLVIVDHVASRWMRVRFWTNAASLKSLSAELKASPEARTSFDEIYFHA